MERYTRLWIYGEIGTSTPCMDTLGCSKLWGHAHLHPSRTRDTNMLSRGYIQRAVVWSYVLLWSWTEFRISSQLYAIYFNNEFLDISSISDFSYTGACTSKCTYPKDSWMIHQKTYMPLKPITSRSPCAINIRHDSNTLLSNLLWRAAGLKKKSEVRVKGVLYFICINIGNNLQSRSGDMFLIKTSDPLSTSLSA